MTVTISTPNAQGNRTFTFSKAVPSQKLLTTAEYAARYLFNAGKGDHGTTEAPRTFDDLSNTERLDILDKYIADTLRDFALVYHITSATEAARLAAEQSGDFEMGILPK